MALVAIAGTLVACGGSSGALDDSTGVRVALKGASSTASTTPNGGGGGGGGGSMATIVIRNVFDNNESYLVECVKKDHQLDGLDFCDELVVLHPGVYEVVVQSHDGCTSPQDHYKIIVKPHETVELRVDLTCGPQNGAADVIVTEDHLPLITDVEFKFHGGGTANKFVCQHGEPVVVTVTAFDKETSCSGLSAEWFSEVNGHWVAVDPANPPLPVPFASVWPYGGDCHFSATIDPAAPLGDYMVKIKVSDGSLSTWLAFPIHMIDCGNPGPCPDP